MHPKFREELLHYVYTTRVYDLNYPALLSSRFGEYDLKGCLRELRILEYNPLSMEQTRLYEHLAFDYSGPTADVPEYIHRSDPEADTEPAFLQLCECIAMNYNPKTITIWLKLSEVETKKILEGKDGRWIAWSSAIRGLEVRNKFVINLFMTKDDNTPETPQEYAAICWGYTKQLRIILMPDCLREVEHFGDNWILYEDEEV